MPILPQRTKVGHPLQASKWQSIPVLLEVDEISALLDSLQPLWIVQMNSLLNNSEAIVSPSAFLSSYATYLNGIKKDTLSLEPTLRAHLSSIWTKSLECVYEVNLPNEQKIVRIATPSIQLQIHRFNYFPLDNSFRSMVFGPDTIFWGLQFSYPFLFQDEQDRLFTPKEINQLPNTKMFKDLQKWMRVHTVPASFIMQQKTVSVPIRIGKACLSWITSHPQLIKKELVFAL